MNNIILVVSADDALVAAVREACQAESCEAVHRQDLRDAESLLHQRLISVCILDAEHLGGARGAERVSRSRPDCALLVYLGIAQAGIDNDFYNAGADAVLTKPVHQAALRAILGRQAAFKRRGLEDRASRRAVPRTPERETAPFGRSADPLTGLRDAAVLLGEASSVRSLSKGLLRFLVEKIGVNRASIFLKPKATSRMAEAVRSVLRSAGAIGWSEGIMEFVCLSTEAGIGRYLAQRGCLLLSDGEAAEADGEIQAEFELLGVDAAMPMFDQERFLGVLALGRRITGERLSGLEIEAIYRSLENVGQGLGQALRNEQAADDYVLLADLIQEFDTACLVSNPEQEIVLSNRAIREWLAGPDSKEVTFSHLPPVLQAGIEHVLRTGTASAPFAHRQAGSSSEFKVTVVPFRGRALLMASRQARDQSGSRAELDAAQVRHTRATAEWLVQEIATDLTPISTYQQAVEDGFGSPALTGLNAALGGAVGRLTRLLDLMRALAQNVRRNPAREAVALHTLMSEVISRLADAAADRGIRIEYAVREALPLVSADRESLTRFIESLLLGEMGRLASGSSISCTAQMVTGTEVEIRVSDTGQGLGDDQLWFLAGHLDFVECYLLAQRLGLSVTARSEAGKGTVFSWSLRREKPMP